MISVFSIPNKVLRRKTIMVFIDVKVESFIHNKMFHSITYIVSTCDPILRLIMTDAEHIKTKLGHKLIQQ